MFSAIGNAGSCETDSMEDELLSAIGSVGSCETDSDEDELLSAIGNAGSCETDSTEDELFSAIGNAGSCETNSDEDELLLAAGSEKDATVERVITTPGHYEFLKIAEGCSKRCTYCIIPYIRGQYRSFEMEDLLAEAEFLAGQGVSELIIIAQETSIYGRDLYGKDMLPELLRRLCEIEGLRWIRVLYCYPEDITDEFLEVMASEPKICKYIDLPIQHASDRILKKMGRRTTHDDIVNKINSIRERVPGVVLRTSLICGFPGETDEDHEILKDFVREIRFDRLGVFTYSQEEGTPAASMPDQIVDDVKTQRRDEIMSIQELISYENLASRIDDIMDVAVDGYLPDEDVYVGRTYMDAPDVDGAFFFRCSRELMSGDHIDCLVTNCSDYDLYGEPV